MKTKIYLALAAFILSVSSYAQTNQTNANTENQKNASDQKDDAAFAMKAADGGMYEVQAGKIAQSKGSSAKIKELGKHMTDDHTKANAELKQLAAKKKITLPTKVSDKRQKDLDELNSLSGMDFDKAYAKKMVSDHKEDISLFEKEAESGKDNEIKSWAAGKVPTLKHHLGMAEGAEETVKETSKK